MNTPSPAATRELVLEVLGEVAPDADLRRLDAETSFRDQFDLDSIDFLNLVLRIEKRLDTRIPEVDYPKLSSLDGAVAYLSGLSV